jgi:AraC family transcriptional regulator
MAKSDRAPGPGASNEDPVRPIFRAAGVVVGQFRCAPSRRDFRTAGAITRHCFVFPRRGVWIQHDGEAPFVADATRITLYNPAQLYERRALDPAGDHSDWITVSDSVAREVVALSDPSAAESPGRVFRYAYAPSSPRLYAAQRKLHEYIQGTTQPDLLFVEETAIKLFGQTIAGLYRHAQGQRPQPLPFTLRHRNIVEDVRAHLNRTYSSNQSLSAIAAAVNTSVYHLCRIFRRGTGQTIHAYRHQLRLRHALETLEDPAADLLTLAIDLGYSGHSHFTAAFRRQFGTVPSLLRRRATSSDGACRSGRN